MNQDQNINNEDKDLNDLSPKLSKLGGKNPFNPSEAYFDSFISKLNERIEDEEDIKGLAPTLLSIDRYNPFEVPLDYFDELPGIVGEKVLASKGSRIDWSWLLIIFRPRFAFPLLVTILIAFAGLYYLKNDAINEVASEELSLEDNLYYISENDIIDQLTADATIEMTSDTEDENSIENYLIDNNIEESNLSTEL